MRLLMYFLTDFDTLVIRNRREVLCEAPVLFPHWLQILQNCPGSLQRFHGLPSPADSCKSFKGFPRTPQESKVVSQSPIELSKLQDFPARSQTEPYRAPPDTQSVPRPFHSFPRRVFHQGPDRALQSSPRHPECPKTSPQLPRESSRWSFWAQTWSHTGSKQNKNNKKSSDLAKVMVLLEAVFNFTYENLWKAMNTQLKAYIFIKSIVLVVFSLLFIGFHK